MTTYAQAGRVAAEMCADLKLTFRNDGGGTWTIINPDNGHTVATLYRTASARYTMAVGGRKVKTRDAGWNVHIHGTPRHTSLVLTGDTWASAKKKATEYVLKFVQDEVAEAMLPQFKVVKAVLAYREAVKPTATTPWKYGIAEYLRVKLQGHKIQFKDGVFGYLTDASNQGFNGIEIFGNAIDGNGFVRAQTVIR